MADRPIVLFTVCWLAGSAAAAALDGRLAVLAAAGLIAGLLAAAMLGKLRWQLAAACIAAVSLAAAQREWADARNVTALAEQHAAALASFPSPAISVKVTGTIVSAVTVDGDRAQFRVKVHTLHAQDELAPRKLSERLLVQLRLAEQPQQEIAASWRRGDRIEAAGELVLPAAAVNFGGFDYRQYLYSQRIHWLLQLRGEELPQVQPGSRWQAAAMLGLVDAARSKLGERLQRLFPAEQSGFMRGLLIGQREDIDPELFQQFSTLGLTHVLAISGLHVAVFLYALHLVLRFFRMPRETTLHILMAAIPCYVLMAGAAPSVMRAGIMALIGLLAAKHQQLKDGLHVLAAAALLMLAAEPYLLGNISFQLSFLVTAGLIIGVPPLRRLLPQGKRLRVPMDILAVSAVAQLISFPMTIYYFNQFHLLSLPANMLIVPLISMAVLPAGLCALLLSYVWMPAALALSAVIGGLNERIFLLVQLLDRIDGLRMIWPSPAVAWIVCWYLVLLLIFRWIAQHYRSKTAPAAVGDSPDTEPLTEPLTSVYEERFEPSALKSLHRSILPVMLLLSIAALLFYAYYPNLGKAPAEVHILDVGQGDAMLVRTPLGKHVLIDGGGTVSFRKPGEEWRTRKRPFEVGAKVVVPLLKKRGVQQIDLLVISHLDTDHMGGLQAVLESIPVKKILWNGTVKASADTLKLLETAVRLKIPLFSACDGSEWELEQQVKLTVLWPLKNCELQAAPKEVFVLKDQNEASMVLLLQIYQSRWLFTGDIGAVSEGMITARSPAENERLDFLKVGHHGSRSSTTEGWMRHWQPRHALISVGRSNFYGHPHPHVIARLQQYGTTILRTDLHGELQIRMYENGYYWRSKLKGSDKPSET